MRLIDVHLTTDPDDTLWTLLAERTPDVSISHRRMPTQAEHRAFVASQPYEAWYYIDVGAPSYAGACYLTRNREIGISILRRFWGFGYGKMAVQMLMERHPGQFLANINPRNYVSAKMFQDLGFNHIQNTFAGPTGNPNER